MRYHYRVDPDTLDEDSWLRLYAEYRMVRKTELKEMETAVYNALATVINKLFDKKDGFNDYTMDS